MELPKSYTPGEVENKIYSLWQKSGFFNPDNLPGKRKKSYVIMIAPPNVTGSLHMGHALENTISDILIRFNRMKGCKALFLPGIDHAGIATQNVVEKELRKEGQNRFDLGREKFIERIWQWKEKYGNIILDQLKRLGVSCDWSRTRFTMDKEYEEAVKAAFLHYFKKGWIYQGKRVINWCPRCQTSLSDLELEYQEEKGKLWYLRYPLAEKSRNADYIIVATTRPETMLGDTAVAVNPKDTRYKKLVGKTVILPIQNRKIPIIADKAVDLKFGTGAVKVTPAHDLTDWEIKERHNLEAPLIIDERGKMTKESKICQGLSTLECREKVLKELENKKLIEKIEEYTHSLPYCYRCHSLIQPLASKQWFLKMQGLAKMAIKAVKSKKVRFTPRNFEKVYFDWLKNIKDWCISRQLWWGHKIPVWQCKMKTLSNKIMGFHEDVVPQVFDGKISTWRLRNHNFKISDVVAFENSQAKEFFGYGTITKVVKTTVGGIDLKDKTHYKTYKNRNELIKAFKRHNPTHEINEDTPVFAYTYTFRKITADDGGCGKTIASHVKPKKCPNCGSAAFTQDNDVLDTWFSSALWPFATLGWPKNNKNLKEFYPANFITSAREIINLWISRMIFSGFEFMKKEPFRDYYCHATVLTKEGKRMSKSLGTGIDPIELINRYGADATRLGIAWQLMGGQDIKFVEDNIVMGKKFCNKLWNASRFVLMQMPDSEFQIKNKLQIPNSRLTPADKKIIEKTEKTVKSVNSDLDKFEFGRAVRTLYDFFWHDFCDVYIEKAKNQNDQKTKIILLSVLLTSLKLLHPFIPFVTEEIYQTLPIKNKKGCLMVEEWPK